MQEGFGEVTLTNSKFTSWKICTTWPVCNIFWGNFYDFAQFLMLSHDTFNHRKRALSCSSTPSKNGQPCYTLHRLFKQSVYDPCLPGGTFYKHAWTLAVKRSHPLSGPKIFGPPGKSSPFAKWGVSLYYKQFKIVDRICSLAPGSVVIDKLKSWRYSKCAGSLFRFQGDVANHFLPPILDVNHCVKEWFLCMSRIQNFQAGKC